jgi:hypothetical protein
MSGGRPADTHCGRTPGALPPSGLSSPVNGPPADRPQGQVRPQRGQRYLIASCTTRWGSPLALAVRSPAEAHSARSCASCSQSLPAIRPFIDMPARGVQRRKQGRSYAQRHPHCAPKDAGYPCVFWFWLRSQCTCYHDERRISPLERECD